MAITTLIASKKILSVAIESPKGTPEATTADIIAYDVELSSTAEFLDRRGMGASMGFNLAGVAGKQTGICNFRAELKGNGSNAMDPVLAVLIKCCAFSAASEVYTPVSTVATGSTCTIRLYEDGTSKVLSGCAGNFVIECEDGKPPYITFAMMGIYGVHVDAALPAYAPDVTTPSLVGTGAFTLAAKAIAISKLNLDMQNELAFRNDVTNGDHYVVTNRAPMMSLDPEAQLKAEYDYHGLFVAGTTGAVSLAIGAGAGNLITIAAPAFQYAEPIKSGDREGILIYDIVGNCNINTGDDEVSITVLTA